MDLRRGERGLVQTSLGPDGKKNEARNLPPYKATTIHLRIRRSVHREHGRRGLLDKEGRTKTEDAVQRQVGLDRSLEIGR